MADPRREQIAEAIRKASPNLSGEFRDHLADAVLAALGEDAEGYSAARGGRANDLWAVVVSTGLYGVQVAGPFKSATEAEEWMGSAESLPDDACAVVPIRGPEPLAGGGQSTESGSPVGGGSPEGWTIYVCPECASHAPPLEEHLGPGHWCEHARRWVDGEPVRVVPVAPPAEGEGRDG